MSREKIKDRGNPVVEQAVEDIMAERESLQEFEQNLLADEVLVEPMKILPHESAETKAFWAEKLKVRVHRINVPDPMRTEPFPLCRNDISEKKTIAPGVWTVLTRGEIETLKQTREEVQTTIPATSAIYLLPPGPERRQAAQEFYPDHEIYENPRTGLIDVSKGTPLFMVDYANESRPY